MEWQPIGHKPPLPRIDTAPRYTSAPQMMPEHIRQQIDAIEHRKQQLAGERIWQHVVEIAKGG